MLELYQPGYQDIAMACSMFTVEVRVCVRDNNWKMYKYENMADV